MLPVIAGSQMADLQLVAASGSNNVPDVLKFGSTTFLQNCKHLTQTCQSLWKQISAWCSASYIGPVTHICAFNLTVWGPGKATKLSSHMDRLRRSCVLKVPVGTESTCWVRKGAAGCTVWAKEKDYFEEWKHSWFTPSQLLLRVKLPKSSQLFCDLRSAMSSNPAILQETSNSCFR